MYIGVDVGGTNLKAARISEDGTIVERRTEAVARGSAAELFGRLESLIRDLDAGGVKGVGVGVPGIIDRDGRVRVAPNLGILDGQFVGQELQRRTGKPTFIENDANAAALAEAWLGAGGGVDNLLFVTLGTGVGGGLILNGRVWSGISGYAGEVGHIQVEEGGWSCGCSSRGCVETIAGAAGWGRVAEARLSGGRRSVLRGQDLTPERISEAARGGDPVALEVVEEAARALGIGIAAALLLVNVERVVIGGGVARAGAVLLDPVIRHTRKRLFPDLFADSLICLASVGGDAGVIGAARVAMVGLLGPVR
jgi:glucokinase